MELLTWLALDHPSVGAAVLLALHLTVALVTSGHVLLHKESERSATGWLALVWLSPLMGSLLYVMLGINRVRRKAAKLRGEVPSGTVHAPRPARIAPDDARVGHLAPMRRALDAVVALPLLDGNHVEPLEDGERAFPAMLEAIASAERTIAMQTFIFDRDPWGLRFVHALAAARHRGVDVRLLIDGVGVWFSWPHLILRELEAAGVPYRRFLWSCNPLRMALLNLRNHRKILVVDGKVGFTGGMNVRGTFVQEGDGPRTAERDLHFRVEGPLVAQLLDLFAADWAFETGEWLTGDAWYPPLPPVGEMAGRVIPDGPDEHVEKGDLTFVEAITCARRRIRIATPYFLPEEPLEIALIAAARRGVDVDVVVPERSNHFLVDWALRAQLPRMLDHGVRVWAQPPPFDHGKLMVVDDRWSCFGSSNWDPRSLRLNFEMVVEVYSPVLADHLADVFERKRARSRLFTSAELRRRPLPVRLRDGAARLLKPYL